MAKTILLDIDGVIMTGSYFSARLAQTYGIDPSLIGQFFKEKFGACVLGQADLKEELLPYLETWGWQGSVDELLTFWFEEKESMDRQVVQAAEEWRAAGIQVYLCSNQEKYRAAYLLHELHLSEMSDGAFFSFDLGLKKADPRFFAEVVRRLGVDPAEITYFDDEEESVDSAISAGIDGRVYASISDLHI